MKRLAAALGITAFLAAAAPAWAVTYTGSLSSASGGLSGTNEWSSGVTVSWVVDDTSNPGQWTYTYTVTTNGNPGAAVQYVVVETAPTFTTADLKAGSTAPAAAPAQHAVPEPIYGVLYSPTEPGGTYTFTIVTDAAPTWGDFYASSGFDGPESRVTNAGFAALDPTLGPWHGSIAHHILRPGLTTVPEPGTLLLLGTGLVGVGAWARKRVRARA